MKKFIYIITALACVLSCSKSFEEPVIDENADDRPTVKVHFTVEAPEAVATRVEWGNRPVIESLWVIEFGASGYYKGWHECTPDSDEYVDENGETNKKGFTVELPISDNDQTFHFIANPPSTTSYLNQTEINVLNSMITTGNNAAFWQKVKVEGGVRGVKQTDGSYIATSETQALFNTIPLIRNFAKVTVFSSQSSIEVVRFALVNVPTKGYVAPYDIKAFDFAEPYMDISRLNINNLSEYVPEDVEISATTNAENLIWSETGNNNSLFMYERPAPTSDPTCVIVEAKNSGTTYFYKIELMNGASYTPIFRDFEYRINMAAVGTERGELYAQDALDNAPFGDVSANLETASLTQISDGTSTLYVSFTDYTHVLTGQETTDPTVTLYYKFDSNPYSLTTELSGTNAVKSIGGEYSGSGDYAGWKAVDLTLNKDATGIAKSMIKVSGKAGEETRELYRKVYVRVMGTQNLSASVSGDASALGNPVTLTVTFPEDLGASLFPVQLFIEAENNTLSADDNKVAAKTGKSVFRPDSNKNTFYFVRTVSYTEYQTSNSITCSFKTNQANAGTDIKVYTERYFNPATATL